MNLDMLWEGEGLQVRRDSRRLTELQWVVAVDTLLLCPQERPYQLLVAMVPLCQWHVGCPLLLREPA